MLKAILSVAALALLTSCASASPPSAFERALYEVRTNVVTNIVQVAQVNPSNNVVTNIVFQTNIFQTFDLQPRPSVEAGIKTGGTVATGFGFGIGGIIASLVLGAYGAYAEWRNGRKAKLNTVFAQNIETAREVIKTVGGAALDSKFKEQIKAQQVDAGVKVMAAEVVDSTVNTVDAKESAEKVNKV